MCRKRGEYILTTAERVVGLQRLRESVMTTGMRVRDFGESQRVRFNYQKACRSLAHARCVRCDRHKACRRHPKSVLTTAKLGELVLTSEDCRSSPSPL